MRRIKEERIKLGLKQKDVADFIGMERTTYGKYESGIIMPPIDVLKNLANLFNVSVDYLIEMTDVRNNKSDTTPEQCELINLYESMNDKGKETAINTMRALAAYPEMCENKEDEQEKKGA